MAERKNPQFGSSGWYQNYSSDLLKGYVAQALGTNAVAPSTSPASTVPDAKMLKRTERKMEQWNKTPYTAEEIAGNEYLKALQTGLSSLTYEQALANVRRQQAAMNTSLLAGTKNTMAAKYASQQAWAKVNADPLTKYAMDIFTRMGGSLQEAPTSRYGGVGSGIVDTTIYSKLGLTPPTTSYAPVQSTTRQVGNRIVTNIANPLSATQRSRLQRLRGMAPSSLSARQKAALTRLRAKKNAPTILP